MRRPVYKDLFVIGSQYPERILVGFEDDSPALPPSPTLAEALRAKSEQLHRRFLYHTRKNS